MRPSRRVLFVSSLLAALPQLMLAAAPAAEAAQPARGADELYWVPTLEQAREMAASTGRPIFLMGYSLVGDGTTYTKTSDEACSGVY